MEPQNIESVHLLQENEENASSWIRFMAGLANFLISVSALFLLFCFCRVLAKDNLPLMYSNGRGTGLMSYYYGFYLDFFWPLILALSILIICSPIWLSLTSTTLGDYFFGLRVTDNNGHEPRLKISFKRSLSFFIVGFLKIFKVENKESWLNYQFESIVIRNTKKSIILGCVASVVVVGLSLFAGYYFILYGWRYRAFDDSYYSVNMPGIVKKSFAISSQNKILNTGTSTSSTSTSLVSVVKLTKTLHSADRDQVYIFSQIQYSLGYETNKETLNQTLSELIKNDTTLDVATMTMQTPYGDLLHFTALSTTTNTYMQGRIVNGKNYQDLVYVMCYIDKCNKRNVVKFINSLFY